MDLALALLTASLVVLLLVTIRYYELDNTRLRQQVADAELNSHTSDALLLLADDRVERAEQHADDSQVLLDSVFRHPGTAGLELIPGGGA